MSDQEERDNYQGDSTLQPMNHFPPVVGRLERGEKMPVCVILVGMAGSGKSTLLTQLQTHLDGIAADAALAKKKQINADERKKSTTEAPPKETEGESKSAENDNNEQEDDDDDEFDEICYCVNLDPATLNVSYDASIDIRDTVDYKQVMKQHKLGPNGAIMTSLNLFATKFDQVMNILEKRAYGSSVSKDHVNPTTSAANINASAPTNEQGNINDAATVTENNIAEEEESTIEYILVDTPGQIEAFTWSASGSIISEALASAFPTVLCFVVDTARCASSPNTFMSNMLYACSMLYRTRLPLVVCFNKVDVVSHEFCMEWMRDYEAFQQALDDVSESAGFYGSLTRSLSLVLDEFYSNFANACGVSALTGAGMDEFFITVQKAATQDFVLDYVDDLKSRIEEQDVRQKAIARTQIKRLARDLNS